MTENKKIKTQKKKNIRLQNHSLGKNDKINQTSFNFDCSNSYVENLSPVPLFRQIAVIFFKNDVTTK